MTTGPLILASLLSAPSLLGFFARPVPVALPGGGTVRLPSAYAPVLPGQFNHDADLPALIAYRKYRSTLAGSWECDGMLAVGHAASFASLAEFEQRVRGALTTSWSYADLKPGWFGGTWNSFPVEQRAGPHGAEMEQELAVHLVGFFDVYDEPARMFALHHQNGLLIAVWIFDSHGGVEKARKTALDIAASFAGWS